jgi:hypothetical protein
VGDGGLLEEPQPGNAAEDDSVALPSLSSTGANLGVESGLDSNGVDVPDCTVDDGPSNERGFVVFELCAGNCGFANPLFKTGDFSGSADGSRDMPGSLMPWFSELSDSLSLLSLSFRLFAADPRPPSAVCRKNVGSLDPSDFAIWLRDSAPSGSVFGKSGGVDGVGEPRNGRGRVEFESLDDGFCCQERVPLLASEVAVGGVGIGVLELFCGGVGNVLLAVGSESSLAKRGD